jgi:transcriptional regulator CtsR
VEGESRTVQGGLSATVVRIQHFSFYSKRGGDGMKRCQKMKRRQRSRLIGSMRMKCDTA